MKILLRVDSRDSHFHQKFGSVTGIPDTMNYDDPNIPEKVQPIGNVECTCYATTYVGQNKTKKEYDIDELFSRIPHTSHGADPRQVLGEVVKNGFLIKGTTTYDKPFSSYWRADTGPYDAFDNARSAMLLAESPIVIWTNWYREWLHLGPNAIMPIGQNTTSSHMYADKGWASATPALVDGEPMFIVEWWGGFTMRMPRDTFNEAVGALGCGCAVLSDSVLDAKREKSLLEKLIDACKNLILLLQAQQQSFLK